MKGNSANCNSSGIIDNDKKARLGTEFQWKN